METGSLKVNEVQSLANAWPIAVGNTFLWRQRLLLPLQRLDHVFFAEMENHTGASCYCKNPCCAAQLTYKPAQASATDAPTAEPKDKANTVSTAEAPTTYVQAGSKSSHHCYHTPCCHTPCRLLINRVCQQNLQSLTFITPLPSPPYLFRVWQPNSFATTVSSHPLYHTPVICFVKFEINHPRLSPACAVYHASSITQRAIKFFGAPNVTTGRVVYTRRRIVYGLLHDRWWIDSLVRPW